MKDLNINIIGIRETLFKSEISYFERNKINSNEIIDSHSIDFVTESINNLNSDKGKIIVKYKITLDLKEEPTSLRLLEFETQISFEFNHLTDLIKRKGEKIIQIEDRLLFLLISTSIGTTRGMLAYKLASFPFDYILPIVDVYSMIKEINTKKSSKV